MENQTKKIIICKECGEEKVSNTTNFYKSVKKDFVVYGGFSNTCKNCLKDMCFHPKSGNVSKEGIVKALEVLDKPFKNDIFDKFDEDSFNIGTYLKNLNLKYKNVRFADSDVSDDAKVMPLYQHDDSDDENFNEDGSRKVIYSRDWRGSYTLGEVEFLDNYYQKLQEDYKIVTQNHKDYARKIAKTSLIMDAVYDEFLQGVAGADKRYNDLQKVFDNLCKSAKFSENTRAINDTGLGSFGQICEKVESKMWIPQWESLNQDQYDDMLMYFNTINKSI